jgi:NitT/TauT family transport system substrate-binding protein
MVKTFTGRRTFLKRTGVAVAGIGLSGCVIGGSGSSSGGATDASVVIPHYGLWDTSIAFLIGQDQGFFEDEGLSVSRIDVSGGGSNVRTVVSGNADIGLATGTTALFAAYREGTNVRIVSNEMNRASDLFWYSKAGSGYEKLEDCTDATIGFSSPGSSTNMVVRKAIESANLENAEAVSVGGTADANASLRGGEIDVAWSTPPFFLDSINSGNMQMVFRGDQVPPFKSMSIRVNFLGNQVLQNEPEKAASYFSAHKKATNWAYNNLNQAVEIWGNAIDNNNHGLLKQAVKNGYPRKALALDAIEGLSDANDLAVNFNFINNKLSMNEQNELINTSPLPSTDGDTYN